MPLSSCNADLINCKFWDWIFDKFQARAQGTAGKKMALFEGNSEWDDVVALAQIAYADEYAEAMGYLRVVMASKEHSPCVLSLTEHIITVNPAHYAVWLYRASNLFALSSPLFSELVWVNEVALENQKNY